MNGTEEIALVDTGRIVITRGAEAILSPDDLLIGLLRHMRADWGDLCEEDKAANDFALLTESRLLSAYRAECGKTFWIITEHDRSRTTILLPNEY